MDLSISGMRPIHRFGVLLPGEFRALDDDPVLGGTTLFSTSKARPAMVRLSRAFNPPGPVDFVGLAVKIPSAYGPGHDQDLIMVSSVAQPVLRRLPFLTIGPLGTMFTSGTTYAAGPERVVFGAGLEPRPRGQLGPAVCAAVGGGLTIRLMAASPRGPWRPVATVSVSGELNDSTDVRFTPSAAGGGLRPVGYVNAFRSIVYAYFQHGDQDGKKEGTGGD